MPLSSVVGASSIIQPGVCTSTTRPASPYDGQVIYETDTNLVKAFDGTAFVTVGPSGVVQVKSTTKTDSFTMTGTTFTDVTGVSVSVTPTSATNKILVLVTVNMGAIANNGSYSRLLRDSTVIAVGDTAGSRIPITSGIAIGNSGSPQSLSFSFVDSPASTSAIVYKIQVRSQGGSLVAINRTQVDIDSTDVSRGISSITVMEVTP